MEELVIRPSTKFIKLGYAAIFVLIVAAVIGQNQFRDSLPPELPVWLIPGILGLLLLWPISRHIRQRFTKMTMIGDKLRYETGMLSKSTRTIQLTKVQDVTVNQTVGQRIAAIGDLSIETAGETSRLTLVNIDSPQVIADRIIDASHHLGGARGALDGGEQAQR